MSAMAGTGDFTAVKSIAAVAGGFVVSLLGGGDALLETMLYAVILDYVVGIVKAVAQKNVSSAIGARGIAKKVLYFLVVAVANLIEVRILGGIAPLREITVMFYICNEGVSILENLIAAGVPLPERLKDVLIQLKEKRKG